ncbi:sugar nucleotide-binding protein [Shewanella metallivivens]|uniref:dTDP-4-dehydrorhamnose reductase n=1 Tax=Shewanella metallivivens TaxID=2872342 RepID=A0ABT5TJ62_9GAMM|nr:sugar nucleotide-binding protein [Shewanella metallivivens]MDD8058641.1 sugar nucleotide-binding protein [Shewanella metallivivens]
MKTILLIGSNGLLGSSLSIKLKNNFNLITVTRKSRDSSYQTDMSSKVDSHDIFNTTNPDIIINLAALTDVDLCEKNISLAYRTNTKIVENIADYAIKKPKTFVIQISTDHLYNFNMSAEEDIRIINNYAMTKYCAEKCLNNVNSIILRTNFFGKSLSSSAQGLCNTMYQKAAKGEELHLFNDVYFSPISIDRLCDIILICIKKKIPGIYNIGSNNGMSKELFILYFLKSCGLPNIKYKSISVDDFKLSTDRPKDMRMNVSLFEKTYGLKLPTLKYEIESVANDFKK